VAVGGRQDVTATLIGTFVVLYAFQMLTVVSQQYALIAIGALLVVTVLVAPGGYVLWVVNVAGRIRGHLAKPPALAEPREPEPARRG
jgi:branched-chain amino acid transport system permease protein